MSKFLYACQICGATYSKWHGKCEKCANWNCIVEEYIERDRKNKIGHSLHEFEISDLGNISEEGLIKYTTGITEFDRVLGGGMIPGATILIYGDPGIGKSTLLLQLCNNAAQQGIEPLYVTGEESIPQIKMRAQRLLIKNQNIKLLSLTEISSIETLVKKMKSPSVLIIDSIQTMYLEHLNSSPGTISQVKACTFELVKICKKYNVTLLIVGHITKDGQVAGPKMLEHMVDTVLSFEGEKQYRIIRTCKNRYGSTNEIGIFDMTGKGLQEVKNPSTIFMPFNNQKTVGSCIFGGIEGTRSILLDIQALVAQSPIAMPKRVAIGCDQNRLGMLIAILNAKMNLRLAQKEIYLNIVGGFKVLETGLDLAVVVALISAVKSIAIERNMIFFGEVGLLGELIDVSHTQIRINEAKNLGFKRIVMPFTKKRYDDNDVEITHIKHIQDLINILC